MGETIQRAERQKRITAKWISPWAAVAKAYTGGSGAWEAEMEDLNSR